MSTIWYHGTTDDIVEFNHPLNWLTTNLDYAKSFGPKVYNCSINTKNIYIINTTDSRIFELIPLLPPFKFSSIFVKILTDLHINEKEAREELKKLAKEYAYSTEYVLKLYTFVRSNYFANKLKEAGFDAVLTKEFGNPSIGVVNPSVITINKMTLQEDTRNMLVSKSRGVGHYKDQSHGKNRFERKRLSKIARTVKQYNQIDMNKLFKEDLLIVHVPVQGETDQYTVSVKMEGVVAEIAKNIKNNKNQFEYRTVIQALTKVFNSQNIYVKCTCDDYKYRFAHWNIVNNVSIDDTASDPGPGKGIRNPNDDKGRGCKHVLLVLANGDWLLKVASVISNYVHYAEEHLQKPFLKLIFPKLYGVPADEMVEQDLIDTDEYLDSSKGLIDAINEYGRNRGKYTKGSNKNPITGTGGRAKKEEEPEEENTEEEEK